MLTGVRQEGTDGYLGYLLNGGVGGAPAQPCEFYPALLRTLG